MGYRRIGSNVGGAVKLEGFIHKPRPTISNSAKDLVRKLLVKDPCARLNAAQALSHPWVIEGGDASDTSLDISVLYNMRQFVKYSRLKQSALREFVRQEALHMLQNTLEGCGGSAASSAYTEAFRLIMRLAVGDKSFTVRIAAARCVRAFANIGGPGLGVAELDNSASYCAKALEDPVSSVRDAFTEALGAVLE